MIKHKRNQAEKRLFQLIKKKALFKERVFLSSGKTSNYYLDGRLVSLSAEGAYLIAEIILDLISGKKISAIGGPTLGADPIAGAVAALSHIRKKPVNTFIVRKVPKAHGRMRQIEGPLLKRGSRVILLDDVATTGKALIEAKQVLESQGIEVKEAIVVVDREEGAAEALAGCGLRLISIFKASDFGV
jgi:orotate phosphoribosyltransferase